MAGMSNLSACPVCGRSDQVSPQRAGALFRTSAVGVASQIKAQGGGLRLLPSKKKG
jgi:hypothetical protein